MQKKQAQEWGECNSRRITKRNEGELKQAGKKKLSLLYNQVKFIFGIEHTGAVEFDMKRSKMQWQRIKTHNCQSICSYFFEDNSIKTLNHCI